MKYTFESGQMVETNYKTVSHKCVTSKINLLKIRYILQKQLLNRTGPSTDPRGTTKIISSQ